jgi:hypothetical protein
MTILVMALATWCISNLLADETLSGPLGVLDKLRALAFRVSEHAHDGLTCQQCNSVWIGAVFTLLYVWRDDVALYTALPFALSAFVVFVEDYVRQGET